MGSSYLNPKRFMMKIAILLMAIMVMSCFSASTLDKRARPNSKGKRQCRSPRGNHGSVLLHGCIQSTCINRKWTPTMRTDICCFKNKPNMPNTEIGTIAGDYNTTTTMRCTEGGQLSFTHSGGQVEQLAAEIEDLKDQSVQQFTDLKELIEKHVEGFPEKCYTASTLFSRKHVCLGCNTAVEALAFMNLNDNRFDHNTRTNHVFGVPQCTGFNGFVCTDKYIKYKGEQCCSGNIEQKTFICTRNAQGGQWMCQIRGQCKSAFLEDNGHFVAADCG